MGVQVTKHFGQDFRSDIPAAGQGNGMQRRATSALFDLLFPMLVVGLGMTIGHFAF